MGCIGSLLWPATIYDVEPKLKQWKHSFDALNIKPKHLMKMYKVFCEIDVDKSGTVLD